MCRSGTVQQIPTPTTIETVKVVRGKDEQKLQPNALVEPGRRFRIVVDADGKATTSLGAR